MRLIWEWSAHGQESGDLHAVDESGGAKPLGSKSEMSTNMTVFLAYAPVGRNAKAFQPNKNSDRRKGRKGKDEPDTLDPSVYPTMVFLLDVDPEIIISRVTYEFGRAGGFYFWKKQLQCEETMTPFIIYFLYTFNDIATLRGEPTSLLEEALQGMKDNFTLPDEFEYASLPDINIRRGAPKLPGQPGSNFRDYSCEMQEARRAHLIKRDIKEIPFLRVLISYIKEMKLAVRIWGGHTHITETVDWDSPKGDVSRFVWMSQDHTNYNMSLVSVQVRGITDLEASAEVTCPESGNVIGRLSLRQTLLKYLKLTDGNPMCAELHQRGPQGPVDMVIPNTSNAECGFEMFNKQPAGYLYHVLPKFGASELFIKSLLLRSMEAGLMTEAPLCTYDFNTHILTTPHDKAQEGVLSDVWYGLSPSFRTSSLRNWLPTPARRIRWLTPLPKCVFNSAALAVSKLCMAQMRGSTTTYPSQVSNCALQVPRPPQPTPRMPISRLSRLLLAKMTPPLMKRERGVMTPCRPPTIRPHRPLVLRKSNPRRPAADSPLQLISLHHGEGEADRGVNWFVWGGWCS
jgi:hypothetical protein